jgi:hypothetical protein
MNFRRTRFETKKKAIEMKRTHARKRQDGVLDDDRASGLLPFYRTGNLNWRCISAQTIARMRMSPFPLIRPRIKNTPIRRKIRPVFSDTPHTNNLWIF